MSSSSGPGGDQTLAPGTRIGPYRITGWLGRGGMGTVYEAADDVAGRAVALKVLAPGLTQEPRFVARFRREIQLASNIQHPHVVACYGAGEVAGRLWLALELVRGGTLADRVKRGPLPPADVARLGFELASALAALHGIGVIHRDLKPANVLVTPEGVAKLSDLGLARGEGVDALTRTGELLGTVEYMAPEMADGGKGVDARADLYSLGCTLYTLLAGEPPFPGSGPQTIAKHMRSVPPPLLERAPGCPRALASIVHQLLAKNPADRGGEASDVARALARVHGQRTTTMKVTASGLVEDEKPRSGRRGLLAAVVVLVAVAGSGLFFLSRREPAPLAAASPSPSPTAKPGASPRPGPAPPSLPAWWKALAPADRPDPLPPGVRVGDAPGEYVNLRDGSILVFVPETRFTLGRVAGRDLPANAFRDELPNVPVTLSAYFIGKYEVSNEEFQKFAAATRYETTTENKGTGKCIHVELENPTAFQYTKIEGATWRSPRGKGPNPPSYPAVQLSWEDGCRYCRWAGLRLPTEAEWERAAAWDAAAGKARVFPWGDDEDSKGKANIVVLVGGSFESRAGDGLLNHLDGVRENKAGASPVGALNMIGNATEWALDFYEKNAYRKLEKRVEKGETVRDPCVIHDDGNGVHVLRGCTFMHAMPTTRCANRSIPDNVANDGTGFRVALSAAGHARDFEERIADLLK